MPVKRISATQIPQNRFQRSPWYDTDVWKRTLRELRKGLGVNEAIEVNPEPETIAQLPLKEPIPALILQLKRWIEKHEYEYDVEKRGRDDNGIARIFISRRGGRIA